MIIYKFGGSSVKNAEALKRVAQLISNEPNLKAVVISATYNTTNNLEELAVQSASGNEAEANTLKTKIFERHIGIAKDLNLPDTCLTKMNDIFDEIDNLSKAMYLVKDKYIKAMDRLYSTGERLSTLLLFELLKKQNVDCALIDTPKIIKTDDNFSQANPIMHIIKKKATELLDAHKSELLIFQGFIGSTLLDETTTLGREGSDYTATILASAMGAESVTIWTDVIGIANSDPRWNESAKYFKNVYAQDAAEMAYLGAKVIHRKTISPLDNSECVINVKSTFEPEQAGTCIGKSKTEPAIPSISYIENLSLLKLAKAQSGHLKKVRELINKLDHYGMEPYLTQEMGQHTIFLFDNGLKTPLLELIARSKSEITLHKNLSLLSIVITDLMHGNHAANFLNSLKEQEIDYLNLFTTERSLSVLTTNKIKKESMNYITNRFL